MRPTAVPAPTPPPEIRGVYACIWDLNSPEKIDRVVSSCRRYGVNSLFVHVRVRGDAYYYPNRTDRRHPNPEPRTVRYPVDPPDLDVLQEVLDRAHDPAQGARIRVHAWLVTIPVWDREDPPTDPDHPYNVHPDWLTRDDQGRTSRPGLHEQAYLDPGLPEVREYLSRIVLDIVRNYEVDGIHLDYIRYGTEDEFGYHPEALWLFQQETGWDAPGDPEMDADFDAWRRDRIGDLARLISRGIRRERPEVELSAFVIGYVDPVAGALCPVDQWGRSGDLDFLVGGRYTTDEALLEPAWERLRGYAGEPGGPILCGAIGAWLEGCDSRELTRQIRFFRANGGGGFVCFDYRALAAKGDSLWSILGGLAP